MNNAEYHKVESLCAEFQRQWIASLRDTLKKHKIPNEVAKSICGDFSFDLLMLFDQGEIEFEDRTYRPFVAFTDDGDGDGDGNDPTIVVEPNGPQFHEYAFGTTDEAYEES